jgi:succinate-semialdehyde dehydrogenase/glutarate-semialdehyde dehydrogenase
MSSFSTVNPKNENTLESFRYATDAECMALVSSSGEAFEHWRRLSLEERLKPILKLAELLTAEAERLGRRATDEMGKPLAQAVKEAEKCALACRYYAEQAEKVLAPIPVPTGAAKSFISFQPLGAILCIMPWNFPYWQVVRFAVPALAAGNSVILKHADNTTGCALELESLFQRAGFPKHVFRVLVLDHDRVERVLASNVVRAVSLTGSERAGSAVGALAGKYLKKSVLELGGSDAYLVLKDAHVEAAAKACVEGRLTNSGQSCVAAKRFIVDASVHDQFTEAFVAHAKKKVVGDPTDPKSDVGPLAKKGILDGVVKQVQDSVAKGAKVLLGGSAHSPGYFHDVTVLGGVTPGMAAFDEEVFGPVAAIIKAKDEAEALRLANLSRYGLGGAVFTRDLAKGEELAEKYVEAGFVVVNGAVQSDPRLPFGGVKNSGYGRELSHFGMREFVNVKTVVVNT